MSLGRGNVYFHYQIWRFQSTIGQSHSLILVCGGVVYHTENTWQSRPTSPMARKQMAGRSGLGSHFSSLKACSHAPKTSHLEAEADRIWITPISVSGHGPVKMSSHLSTPPFFEGIRARFLTAFATQRSVFPDMVLGGVSLKRSQWPAQGSESSTDSFLFLCRLLAVMGRRSPMKWSWSGLLSWVWADVCPLPSPSSIMPRLRSSPFFGPSSPTPSLPIPNK